MKALMAIAFICSTILFSGSLAQASGKPVCDEKQEARGCKGVATNCRDHTIPSTRCWQDATGTWTCHDDSSTTTFCDYVCECPSSKPKKPKKPKLMSADDLAREWEVQDEALFGN